MWDGLCRSLYALRSPPQALHHGGRRAESGPLALQHHYTGPEMTGTFTLHIQRSKTQVVGVVAALRRNIKLTSATSTRRKRLKWPRVFIGANWYHSIERTKSRIFGCWRSNCD